MSIPRTTGQEVGVKWARSVTEQRVYMPREPQLDLVREAAAGRVPPELRALVERAIELAGHDLQGPDAERAFWQGFSEGAGAALLERDTLTPN